LSACSVSSPTIPDTALVKKEKKKKKKMELEEPKEVGVPEGEAVVRIHSFYKVPYKMQM
jgi:hypothetical protein